MELTLTLLIVMIVMIAIQICLGIPERVWKLLFVFMSTLPFFLCLHFLESCVLIDIVLLD